MPGAELCNDRRGDEIGLLRRDPALLDREGGDIADCEDPIRPTALHCSSTRTKPSASCGIPAISRPSRRGRLITASASISSPKRPPGGRRRNEQGQRRRGPRPALFQQAAHLLAGTTTEELQRGILGRDHGDLGAPDTGLGQGGHAEQRQLVERQRPAAAAGHGEARRCSAPARRSPITSPT